jgi:hypothetical protein
MSMARSCLELADAASMDVTVVTPSVASTSAEDGIEDRHQVDHRLVLHAGLHDAADREEQARADSGMILFGGPGHLGELARDRFGVAEAFDEGP